MATEYPIWTYNSGFTIKSGDLSTAKLRSIIKTLRENHHIHVKPENVFEGGLLFADCDRNDIAYKSMRLCIKNWPGADAVLDESTDIPLEYKGDTILKAFYKHCPPWTFTELDRFKQVFEEHGLKINKMPKSLKYHQAMRAVNPWVNNFPINTHPLTIGQ